MMPSIAAAAGPPRHPLPPPGPSMGSMLHPAGRMFAFIGMQDRAIVEQSEAQTYDEQLVATRPATLVE